MTGRPALALGAALCLALSAALAPPPAAEGRGLIGSVGASMGGLRVMVIDALFLRAEAQRKAGRIDDAASLYETVLELDPANEAGTIFLVNVIVDELLPQAASLDARFRWFQSARELLMRALERRPRSAPLHTRAGTLVLDAAYVEEGFLPLLSEALGIPRLVALRHLRAAMRITDTLPRGRPHLLRLAVFTPLVAAHAVAEGSDAVFDEMVETAAETLALRGEVLAQMRDVDGARADLRRMLALGMRAVTATRAALATGDSTAAARRIREFEALFPDHPLGRDLRGLLGK